MLPNTIDRNGIHWVRCTACGDSKNSRKAHCMIDDKGSSYCFRCGHSTQLSINAFIAIALGDMTVDEVLNNAVAEERTYSPKKWHRAPLLEQWAIDGQPNWVSFQMRDSNANVIGWHNRNMKVKECNNELKRGLGYVGGALVSSPSSPLIIVEGPADVISDRHCCVFGTISASSLRQCRLQYVWLFPDPDCIDTLIKRERFTRNTITPAIDNGMVFILGIIVGNADPDEATVIKHIKVEDWYANYLRMGGALW